MYEALETFFAHENSDEEDEKAKQVQAKTDRITTEYASGEIPVYDKGKLIAKKRLKDISPYRGTTVKLDAIGIIERVDLRPE